MIKLKANVKDYQHYQRFLKKILRKENAVLQWVEPIDFPSADVFLQHESTSTLHSLGYRSDL